MSVKIEVVELDWKSPEPKRMHEIAGNECAKRALEVALAGPHEVVILSLVRSPASKLLRAAARIAKENGIPFRGSVVPACPCGGYGSVKEECNCSAKDMRDYALKVVPMMRPASIVIETCEPSANDQARGTKGNEPESTMTARVLTARKIDSAHDLSYDAEEFLRTAIREVGADRDKVVAVASTIARLDRSERVNTCHVAEAVQYQHRSAARWFDGFEEAKA